MAKKIPTLTVVRCLTNQGEKILNNRWLPFVNALATLLKQSAIEEKGSNDEIIILSFPSPALAIKTIQTAIQQIKEEFDWEDASGNAPLQIIIHPKKSPSTLELHETQATFWTHLTYEEIYITDIFANAWDKLPERKQLPAYANKQDVAGCYRLEKGSSAADGQKQLFSCRGVAVEGDIAECFYCGMHNHKPSDCPSKKIGIDIRSIDELGFLNFTEINAIYPKAFSNFLPLIKKMIAGVKPKEIRKNKELLILTSFLDIYVIYQFRFLWHQAFANNSSWSGTKCTEELTLDNKNLQLGLDSLRVGDYDSARKMLVLESRQVSSKKSFYAFIGLTFLALETDKPKEMGRYLERALELAASEKEKIYGLLLQTRFYELQQNDWQLRETMSSLQGVNFDAIDVQYRKLQLIVKDDNNHKQVNKLLKTMLVGNKEFFLLTIMDPALIPIQGILDAKASKIFQNLQKEATDSMNKAKGEFRKLQSWFAQDDAFIKSQFTSLRTLNKLLKNQSYYGLLEVAERCQGIVKNSKKALEEQKTLLDKGLSSIADNLDLCSKTWHNFDYKKSFKTFQANLLQAQANLKRAQKLLQNSDAKSHLRAQTVFKKLEEEISSLMGQQKNMLKISLFIKGFRIFGKKLLIVEALFLLIAVIFYLAAPALQQSKLAFLAQLASNPSSLKVVLIFSFIFIAPCVTLIWSMRTQIIQQG